VTKTFTYTPPLIANPNQYFVQLWAKWFGLTKIRGLMTSTTFSTLATPATVTIQAWSSVAVSFIGNVPVGATPDMSALIDITAGPISNPTVINAPITDTDILSLFIQFNANASGAGNTLQYIISDQPVPYYSNVAA
jgi:hypothetical protein